MTEFVLVAGAWLGAWAWDVPGTYIRCLLDGGDVLSPAAAVLLAHPTWDLVKLDTGHWPMFSAPADLAEVLVGAAR